MRLMTCLAALGFALVAGNATAQDFPPVVQDLPQGYELPSGVAPDVLGIALGQSRVDAQTAIDAALPGLRKAAELSGVYYSDQMGHNFQKDYYAYDMAIGDVDGRSVTLMVTYTTAISGERVMGIQRDEGYAEGSQPEAAALLSSLRDKYGPPQFEKLTDANAWLIWAWTPNGSAGDPDTALHCEGGSSVLQYDYAEQRDDVLPDCNAAMSVTISYTPARPDLVYSFSLKLASWRRAFDNGVATDNYVRAEVQNALGKVSSGEAPAL